jgi:hypothetical protein
MVWMDAEGPENGENHEGAVFTRVWFAIVLVAEANVGRCARVENQVAVEHQMSLASERIPCVRTYHFSNLT